MQEYYNERFDRQSDFPVPKKTVMLATIPRSGSSLFGLRMWSTGILGAPLEYLNEDVNRSIFRRLGDGTVATYWRELQRLRQSRNGIFSFKMFIANYLRLKKSDPEFISTLSPDQVIFLTRDDRLAQAISYARAIQTSRWFNDAADQRPPEYVFGLIRRQLVAIKKQEETWERIFHLTGTEPLRVTYEELLHDERECLSKIAAFVGERPEAPPESSSYLIERQADALTSEWRRRYIEDLGKQFNVAA